MVSKPLIETFHKSAEYYDFLILELSVISNHFIDLFSRYSLSLYSDIFRAGV